MSIPNWDYPLYLIPHGGGYVSLVAPETHRGSDQLLAVFTELELTTAFMEKVGIEINPFLLHNDREFVWLLRRLSDRVTRVIFDPEADAEKEQSGVKVACEELLSHHLKADFSPWNYPIYVIAQENGFVSIVGQADDGRPLTAIAIFTSEDKANTYLQASGEDGSLCAIKDLQQARKFLSGLAIDVFSVALDIVAMGEKRIASHCFDIATLLDKYLIKE